MTRFLTARPWLLALLIGISSGFAASSALAWPLVLVLLIPLVSLLNNPHIAFPRALRIGFFFGLGYAGVLFLWTFTWLHLLVIAHLPVGIAVAMSSYSWTLTVGAPTVGYALWAASHAWLWRKIPNRHLAALLSSIAFVVLEILGTFLFQVTLMGKGGTLAPHFTYAMLGYTLAHSVLLIQLAWLGGIWLLSFACIYTNIALREVYIEKRFAFLLVPVMLFIVACSVFLYRSHPSTFPTLRVGLVHDNFDTNFVITNESILKRQVTLNTQLLTLAQQKPALVLMPEGSDVGALDKDLRSRKEESGLANLLAEGVVVADAGVAELGTQQRTRLRYLGVVPEVFADKRVLLPQGEYIPYIQQFLQGLIASPSSFAALQNERLFTPGDLNTNVAILGGVVGARFCSESMSPFLYTYNTHKGAQLLVNVASHSWFAGSKLLTRRTENIDQVRAVESSRWFVQAGNKTTSLVIDPLGRIVLRIEDDIPRVFPVELRTDTSPYQWMAGKIMYAMGY